MISFPSLKILKDGSTSRNTPQHVDTLVVPMQHGPTKVQHSVSSHAGELKAFQENEGDKQISSDAYYTRKIMNETRPEACPRASVLS